MRNIHKRLLEKLEKRKTQGNLRSLSVRDKLVDFSSNDYLGLTRNEELREDINRLNLKNKSMSGSTGSRLLTGNSPQYIQLEATLAAYFQAPAALLFNSGYTANLALISSVPQRGDTILYDQHIHACVKEGARLSNSKYLTFRHNDPKDLERKLRGSEGHKYVVVESLYSMEGDYPPIREYIDVCKNYQAELIIDEAHTTGWAGPEGRGWSVKKEITHHFLGRIYTFGKAMGAYGACVVGSKDLIEYLVNFSRPFIYTTALPPHNLIAIDRTIQYLEQQPDPGSGLMQKINHYLKLARKLNIDGSNNPDSPIQWIRTGGNARTRRLSEQLAVSGFDVRPILSPTVPKGTERLRICLHAFNSEEQISNLLKSIASL